MIAYSQLIPFLEYIIYAVSAFEMNNALGISKHLLTRYTLSCSCPECGSSKVVEEMCMSNLTVNAPANSKFVAFLPDVHLGQPCTRPDQEDWVCPHCHSLISSSTTRISLTALPDILVITPARTSSVSTSKKHFHFLVPDGFTFGDTQQVFGERKYELVATFRHCGNTSTSGHYNLCVATTKTSWFLVEPGAAARRPTCRPIATQDALSHPDTSHAIYVCTEKRFPDVSSKEAHVVSSQATSTSQCALGHQRLEPSGSSPWPPCHGPLPQEPNEGARNAAFQDWLENETLIPRSSSKYALRTIVRTPRPGRRSSQSLARSRLSQTPAEGYSAPRVSHEEQERGGTPRCLKRALDDEGTHPPRPILIAKLGRFASEVDAHSFSTAMDGVSPPRKLVQNLEQQPQAPATSSSIQPESQPVSSSTRLLGGGGFRGRKPSHRHLQKGSTTIHHSPFHSSQGVMENAMALYGGRARMGRSSSRPSGPPRSVKIAFSVDSAIAAPFALN